VGRFVKHLIVLHEISLMMGHEMIFIMQGGAHEGYFKCLVMGKKWFNFTLPPSLGWEPMFSDKQLNITSLVMGCKGHVKYSTQLPINKD
jgi:hypothetical protein